MTWADTIVIAVGFLIFAAIGYAMAWYDVRNDVRNLEDKLKIRAIEIARLKRRIAHANRLAASTIRSPKKTSMEIAETDCYER